MSNSDPDVKSDVNDVDMTDMLYELRILLPGAQLLNGFLITLPFSSGFRQIVELEKWVFLATFVCSLTSLILFTAPAVQHRVLRPLEDRIHFKDIASRQMVAGAVFLSLALILCANLVTSEAVGHSLGLILSALVTAIVIALWWILPWQLHRTKRRKS